MNVLDRSYWGPRFWKVLHTLAQCSGNLQNPTMRNDEADLWKMLLKTQSFVMPCALCKQHYLEYKLNVPLLELRNLSNPDRKYFLTNWLWKCHSNVNTQAQKESPPEETLSDLYPLQSIRNEVNELILMFNLALQRSQLQREDTQRWKTCLARLQILYGL